MLVYQLDIKEASGDLVLRCLCCGQAAASPCPGSRNLPGSSGRFGVLSCDFEFSNQAALRTRVESPGAPSLGAAGLVGASSD